MSASAWTITSFISAEKDNVDQQINQIWKLKGNGNGIKFKRLQKALRSVQRQRITIQLAANGMHRYTQVDNGNGNPQRMLVVYLWAEIGLGLFAFDNIQ